MCNDDNKEEIMTIACMRRQIYKSIREEQEDEYQEQRLCDRYNKATALKDRRNRTRSGYAFVVIILLMIAASFIHL